MSNGTEQFTIGSLVQCSDGDCGTLRRVVVEPIDRVLTHLVVEPEGRERSGRLVPLDLVDWEAKAQAASQIFLRCSLAEFDALDEAQETHFLSGSSGQWGYEPEQVLTWPNYPLGPDGAIPPDPGLDDPLLVGDPVVDPFGDVAVEGVAVNTVNPVEGPAEAPVSAPAAASFSAPGSVSAAAPATGYAPDLAADTPAELAGEPTADADLAADPTVDDAANTGMDVFSADAAPHAVVRERVPVGEVQIRRGEHVQAVDGSIGRVQGLVVDPADRHVTYVLLDQGHLWGQKRVAIPIRAVIDIEDGVRINLTKDEVRDLPNVDVTLPD